MNEYIKASEAAALLDISPRTVIRWAESGVLRVTKVSGATGPWLINRADVEALAEQKAVTS